MDNAQDPRPNDPSLDTEEQQRQENWRALQIALGLDPNDVPPPPAPKPAATPSSAPAVAPRSPRNKATPEPVATGGFGAGLLDEIEMPVVAKVGVEATLQSSTAAPSDDQEVEVGEAPEEVPEEPGEESGEAGDKKRRRRRRRRRRNGDETEAAGETVNGEASADALPAASADAPIIESDADEGDEEDDEDDDIEPLQIPDWNVPTWQELIGGLYRPER